MYYIFTINGDEKSNILFHYSLDILIKNKY